MASLKSLLSSLLDRFYSKNEKSTVSTLGYSTSNWIAYSGWTASNKYYTIPENGFIYVSCRSTTTNQYLNLSKHNFIVYETRSTGGAALLTIFIHVTKGERIRVDTDISNVKFETFGVYKNAGST